MPTCSVGLGVFGDPGEVVDDGVEGVGGERVVGDLWGHGLGGVGGFGGLLVQPSSAPSQSLSIPSQVSTAPG